MVVKLEKLFSPIKVGSLTLKNRLVMSAVDTNYGDEHGEVTSRLIAFYTERAKNCVSMITIGSTAISSLARTHLNQLIINKDDYVSGLAKLVNTLKQYDCQAVIQLNHAGRRARPSLNADAVPLGPSPLPAVGNTMPRELTLDDIENLKEEFAAAAIRARKAGFDAVELHGGHGYLIAQFLSPLSNIRTDRYGGSLKNRTRFAREVVRRIKEVTGEGYPVLMKLSVDEFLPGGLIQDDTKEIARMLQDAGVDAFTASAGHTGASKEVFARPVPGASFPRGCHVFLAQALKENITVPVGAVGRINDPVLADQIIKENKADLIYMGRALIADPELPAKAMQGRIEDIRTCIACGMCMKTLHTLRPEDSNMSCSINATAGKEETYQNVLPEISRKVLVIGGGPAGMEAARVAAQMGHKVTLYEKERQLGGQLLLASIPPHKGEIPYFVRYLSTQIKKLGVVVELGKEFNTENINDLRPDVIIVATGSVPCQPSMPGLDDINIVVADDVLAGKVIVKDAAVAIIGGGLVGCETAELLAVRGLKKVTLVEMLLEIAEGMEETARLLLLQRLKSYGFVVLTTASVLRIKHNAVVLENGREIEADLVIMATGRKPNNEPTKSLTNLASEVYSIGDCVKPRQIIDAIREGNDLAHKISYKSIKEAK
ncbi:FAD-dependent oxidoreductase [Chloroflexota bacterium]